VDEAEADQQERTHNTRTFLAVDGSKVIGYYATTAYRLGLNEVAEMYGVGNCLCRLKICWLLLSPCLVDLYVPETYS
jgi:hypothetical protein